MAYVTTKYVFPMPLQFTDIRLSPGTRTKNTLATVLGAILFLVSAGEVHAGWPRVPVPPTTKVEALGRVMTWNTIPMRAQLFKSQLPVERVLAFFRDRWDDGFAENDYGPWRQISRQEDEYFITVQVQPDPEGGSHGRISIMHLHDRPVERLGTGVPMLQGSNVFNDLRSEDAGRRSRMTGLVNRFSLESNLDFYRRHYLERGWGVAMIQDVEEGHVSVFRKGNDEVTVVLNSTGMGTTVLINEVTASGFLSW